MFNTDNKLTILAIGAHGDDIELACGGSLAKAISKGHQVIGTDIDETKLRNIRILTIENKNLMTIPANKILESRNTLTIVGGRAVYNSLNN